MAHVYFTSYARLDAEGTRLAKVFDKLKTRVRALLGINDPADLATLAFVDSQDIQTGEEWQNRLAAAVHQAQVLVCFLSPTYFNSEWCAKEFAVFRRRLDQLDGAHRGLARSFRCSGSSDWSPAWSRNTSTRTIGFPRRTAPKGSEPCSRTRPGATTRK